MREFLIPTIGVGTQTIPSQHIGGDINGSFRLDKPTDMVVAASMSAAIYHYAIPLACIVAICFGGWMFLQGIKEPISKNKNLHKPQPLGPETLKSATINEIGQGLSPSNILPIKRTAAVGFAQPQIDATALPVKGKALPDRLPPPGDNLPPKSQAEPCSKAVESLKTPIETRPKSSSEEDMTLSYHALPYINGQKESLKSDDELDDLEEIDITSEGTGSSGTLTNPASPLGSPLSSPTSSPSSSPLGSPSTSPTNSPPSSALGSPSTSPTGSPPSSPLGSLSTSPTKSPLSLRLTRKSLVEPVDQALPLSRAVSAPSSPKSAVKKATLLNKIKKLPKEKLSDIAEKYCSD